MGKKRIATNASAEASRFTDERDSGVAKGPSETGNWFDVSLAEEVNSQVVARKVVDLLADRGVCTCEANAPHDLLSAAFEEAEAAYSAGCFGPPIQVYDDSSQLEAAIWQEVVYKDEQKVLIINPEEKKDGLEALGLLTQNMQDFCRDLLDLLSPSTGISFTHIMNGMLSCYTGNREYVLHVDNPHGAQERKLADNGFRVTICYYINPHWNPEEKGAPVNGGGLDVYLTDPRSTPAGAFEARKAKKLRIAPHADTLGVFLSERMAHQVIATKGEQKWFCLWMWCYDEQAMGDFCWKCEEMGKEGDEGSDDDYLD